MKPGANGVFGKVNGEDSQLAVYVGAELGLLTADSKIVLLVGDNRGTEKLVPIRGGHG